MKFYGLILAAGLAAAEGGRHEAAAAPVPDRIDWPAFLARHDLVWDKTPRQWHEGAFLGNGLVGTMIWARPDEALHWDVGRSDVTDRGNRIAIGRFELVTKGAATGGDMRLDLWNAEATGRLKTDKGRIRWRSFTHADRPVTVVELDAQGGEADARFEFRHEPALDARKVHKKEPIPENERNPAPTFGEGGGLNWCVQPFLAGGGYVVAWGRAGATFAWTVDYVPAGAPDPAAAQTAVRGALGQGIKDLAASHRAWWHAWWPKGFLSVPDTRVESFYWIQMYKLGSATRADRPAIDLMGPWFRSTPWPRIWWNLNIQLTYWPVTVANRLDIGESLARMLDNGVSNLVANVPEAMRADSAGIGRTSSYDCRGGAGSELGNLTWALHNYWLLCRYAGDDEALKKRLYPLLSRGAMYLVRNLKPGSDGRLHFPEDTSPEYSKRAPDTNYNLSILRWALGALLASNERFGLNDPLAPRWRETLATLAPYPYDAKTGYMIGAGVPLEQSHRHFSHLLMFYPLHVVDCDDPAERARLEKSLDHWIGFEGALQGYSFTGASAMSSWLRRKDEAVKLLNQFLDRYVKANTMYLEAGPVIETPLAGAASVHEILLQSATPDPFKPLIRVFPAVPDSWKDATIHNLRAEGGFLLSASRRDGRTRFVQITSLAGEPCRVETGLAGDVEARGARAFQLKTEKDRAGRPVTVVDLKKGETVLLVSKSSPPAESELVVAPVPAQPERVNLYGSPKPVPVKQAPDGAVLLKAGEAQLMGDLLFEKKAPGGNIGHWTNPSDAVTWLVQLDKPGRFAAKASYASPGAGTPWSVSVDAVRDGEKARVASVKSRTQATGGWDVFKDVEIGPIDIPAPGRFEVSARGDEGKAPSINLERITLAPVAP